MRTKLTIASWQVQEFIALIKFPPGFPNNDAILTDWHSEAGKRYSPMR
jgi:hypothetical protein